MRLYFQAGKRRIAIDTTKETYNTNYSYLGGWKEYIKIKVSDYVRIMKEINFNCYNYDENF